MDLHLETRYRPLLRNERTALAWSLRVLLLIITLALGAAGCRCEASTGDKPDPTGAKPVSGQLPPLELRDDTENLLLTWIDAKGDFHVSQKIDAIPEAAREAVRVVITTKVEGTGKLVYVADLRKKKPNGSYAVSTLSRAQWDEKGAAKRKARMEALAPPPPSASGAPQPPDPGIDPAADGVVVIVYGAEWCKPCHDAKRHLERRGVKVIYKDVEENEIYAREMRAKLARANQRTASIPIIDVMGQILVGFEPRALDRAVEAAKNSKTL